MVSNVLAEFLMQFSVPSLPAALGLAHCSAESALYYVPCESEVLYVYLCGPYCPVYKTNKQAVSINKKKNNNKYANL